MDVIQSILVTIVSPNGNHEEQNAKLKQLETMASNSPQIVVIHLLKCIQNTSFCTPSIINASLLFSSRIVLNNTEQFSSLEEQPRLFLQSQVITLFQRNDFSPQQREYLVDIINVLAECMRDTWNFNEWILQQFQNSNPNHVYSALSCLSYRLYKLRIDPTQAIHDLVGSLMYHESHFFIFPALKCVLAAYDQMSDLLTNFPPLLLVIPDEAALVDCMNECISSIWYERNAFENIGVGVIEALMQIVQNPAINVSTKFTALELYGYLCNKCAGQIVDKIQQIVGFLIAVLQNDELNEAGYKAFHKLVNTFQESPLFVELTSSFLDQIDVSNPVAMRLSIQLIHLTLSISMTYYNINLYKDYLAPLINASIEFPPLQIYGASLFRRLCYLNQELISSNFDTAIPIEELTQIFINFVTHSSDESVTEELLKGIQNCESQNNSLLVGFLLQTLSAFPPSQLPRAISLLSNSNNEEAIPAMECLWTIVNAQPPDEIGFSALEVISQFIHLTPERIPAFATSLSGFFGNDYSSASQSSLYSAALNLIQKQLVPPEFVAATFLSLQHYLAADVKYRVVPISTPLADLNNEITLTINDLNEIRIFDSEQINSFIDALATMSSIVKQAPQCANMDIVIQQIEKWLSDESPSLVQMAASDLFNETLPYIQNPEFAIHVANFMMKYIDPNFIPYLTSIVKKYRGFDFGQNTFPLTVIEFWFSMANEWVYQFDDFLEKAKSINSNDWNNELQVEGNSLRLLLQEILLTWGGQYHAQIVSNSNELLEICDPEISLQINYQKCFFIGEIVINDPAITPEELLRFTSQIVAVFKRYSSFSLFKLLTRIINKIALPVPFLVDIMQSITIPEEEVCYVVIAKLLLAIYHRLFGSGDCSQIEHTILSLIFKDRIKEDFAQFIRNPNFAFFMQNAQSLTTEEKAALAQLLASCTAQNE